MNNIETEFKFKIDRLPVEYLGYAKIYSFKQIYFKGEDKLDILKELFPDIDFSSIRTYRVRYVEGENHKTIVLTIKSGTLPNGMSRTEVEKEIDDSVASLLITGSTISTIIKNRYIDNCGGYCLEFDEYLNLRTELYTVEIEVNEDVKYEDNVEKLLKMVEEHYHVECRDVTFNPMYKNSNLIRYFG